MFDDALIVEHARRQDDVEVDRGVAEVRVAHERLCVRIVVHARENFLRRLNRGAFHGGEVAVVCDADGDADIDVLRGQTEIGDVRTRDGLVRDDDGAARAKRDDGGKAPCDVRDAPLLARSEADVVADAQLF